MRKGQMFTMDMALSMLVFIGIAGLSITMVNSAFDSKAFLSEEELMEQKLKRTSDLLVRTGGYPENWNHSNVELPGIAEPSHVLQPEKFIELRRMSYRDFRSANRIYGYGFRMDILVEGNTTGIGGVCQGDTAVVTGYEDVSVEDVERSGYTYDLYWSGDGEAPYEDYRNFYNGSEQDMFESALSNSSNYSCILSVSPGLSSDDISNSERLEDFVRTGTYVQIGPGELIESFGGSSYTFTGNGTAETSDPVLNRNISVGEEIVFRNSSLSFEDAEKSFVTDENGRCGVCRLSESVYYMTDSEFLDGTGYEEVYEQFFFGAESVFGESYATAEDVVPVTRNIVLNRSENRQRAVARMVLWK